MKIFCPYSLLLCSHLTNSTLGCLPRDWVYAQNHRGLDASRFILSTTVVRILYKEKIEKVFLYLE